MVGAWPHRPGTLRALITILKGSCHIVCRPCERYAPLSANREDLDRPYETCPVRLPEVRRAGRDRAGRAGWLHADPAGAANAQVQDG